MFTGLVEEVGVVAALEGGLPEGARLEIRAPLVREGMAIGDSVSVNGACLTAVALPADGFAVQCAPETLRRTALGALRAGDRVNLERPLRAGDRLGGHIVQGHVDATGTVAAVRREGESVVMEVAAPPELMRYVVEKGSVAVDGVSLTVAARMPDRFAVALIPHTLAATTLGEAAPGRPVNLEADVVAKYVEALVRPLA